MRARLTIAPPLLIALTACSELPIVEIGSPMQAPDWAVLERELLDANSAAVEKFADRYLDERGYLLHTPRWGTLDGPDDAIETFYNWTLLHTLGGSDSVLELYKKGLEGHLQQYGELRTELTTLASNGAYHREFITQSDWFHTGEGMRAFLLMGHSDPENDLLVERMERFARMYTGEDPDAPNYDPEHKVIPSIWKREPRANAAQGYRLRLGWRPNPWQVPSPAQSGKEIGAAGPRGMVPAHAGPLRRVFGLGR